MSSTRFTQSDVNAFNARQNRAGLEQPFSDTSIESRLHEKIIDECERRGWLYLHGAMSKRTHRTAGEPDFLIYADKGRLFSVECKSASGKLSLEQSALIAHASKLGHTVHVVRSMQQFLELVR